MEQYKIMDIRNESLPDETSLTEAEVMTDGKETFYLGMYNVAGNMLLLTKTVESQMEKYLDGFADEDESYLPWLESQAISEGSDLEELYQETPQVYREAVYAICKEYDEDFEIEMEEEKMTFKEISRRSMYSEDEGMACGPVSIAAADAEIVIEDNGEKIYLHAQWVDAASDDILFEATKESTYDVYEKLNHDDGDFDELIDERDRIVEGRIEDDSKYADIYEELKEMIIEKLKENDIDPYFLEEDEDDWDEDDEEDEE